MLMLGSAAAQTGRCACGATGAFDAASRFSGRRSSIEAARRALSTVPMVAPRGSPDHWYELYIIARNTPGVERVEYAPLPIE
jgi:hypothetical protein